MGIPVSITGPTEIQKSVNIQKNDPKSGGFKSGRAADIPSISLVGGVRKMNAVLKQKNLVRCHNPPLEIPLFLPLKKLQFVQK